MKRLIFSIGAALALVAIAYATAEADVVPFALLAGIVLEPPTILAGFVTGAVSASGSLTVAWVLWTAVLYVVFTAASARSR